jgi:hypothetical protein
VLVQLVLRARALDRRADENGALDRRLERDDVACDVSVLQKIAGGRVPLD